MTSPSFREREREYQAAQYAKRKERAEQEALIEIGAEEREKRIRMPVFTIQKGNDDAEQRDT